MKRAKIALTAIAMFAVIGGALAYKSYRGVITYYRPIANGTGACTLTATGFTPTTSVIPNVYATTLPGALCTLPRVLVVAP